MTADQGKLLANQYQQKIASQNVTSLIEDQKIILKVPLKDRVHTRADSMRSSQYVFMPSESKEPASAGLSAARTNSQSVVVKSNAAPM